MKEDYLTSKISDFELKSKSFDKINIDYNPIFKTMDNFEKKIIFNPKNNEIDLLKKEIEYFKNENKYLNNKISEVKLYFLKNL